MTGASELRADELPINPKDQQRLEAILTRIGAEHDDRLNAPWHHPGSPLAIPGGGPRGGLGTSVNWHEMEDDVFASTFGALCTFLEWAIPRWNFTTEQFPHHCWWMHTDVFEEITAWWGLWLTYILNPHADIADAVTFHERTDALKDRLATTYRGRCRHKHEPAPDAPLVQVPDLASLGLLIASPSTSLLGLRTLTYSRIDDGVPVSVLGVESSRETSAHIQDYSTAHSRLSPSPAGQSSHHETSPGTDNLRGDPAFIDCED